MEATVIEYLIQVSPLLAILSVMLALAWADYRRLHGPIAWRFDNLRREP